MADSIATSSQGEDSRPTTPGPRETNRAPAYHFQWDLDSRRKGPGSVVSETTESRTGAADAPSHRTEAFFENIHSGTATPSFPTSWSASTQGFNAISTVLNNPRTKPNPLKASKAPQPPVHSPELKRIRRKDFDPYLKTIGPAWQRFEQSQKEALNPTPAFGSPIPPVSPGLEDRNQLHPSTSLPADPSSSNSASRSSLPPLSSVPSVYFNSSFDLSDPRTFATVTEQGTGAAQQSTISSPTDIALNQILQEKMSHYMDVVEQHLVREIAIRSAPFFAALSNLQDLQTEGAACLSRIARLKAQLHEVDNCQARRGLQVVHLQTKRDNLAQLQQVVKNVREVAEMGAMAKHLGDEGDHFAALGLTESIEALLERKEEPEHPPETPPTSSRRPPRHAVQESGEVFSLPTVIESPDAPTIAFPRNDFAPPNSRDLTALAPTRLPVDLTSLVSLSELPPKLSELKTNISAALQKDLLTLLAEDLVDQTADLESSSSTEPSSNTTRPEAWTAQLRVILDGLLRTGGVERAFAGYKEVALAQINMLVKAHQVSAGDVHDPSIQDSELNGKDNAGFVKKMQHDEFMRLLRSLYATLLKSIRTTQEHGSLIQKDIEEIQQQHPNRAPLVDLTEECPAIVFAVAELASSCAAKLINARAEQHVGLPWPYFLELYNETSAFNVNSEILCRTMIIALRGAVNSQAKAYLSAFHSQRISESAKLVEEETWTAVDVSPKFQRLVLALVEAAVSNPPEILAQPSTTTVPSGEDASGGPPPKYITIEDQQYHVVGATLQAIRLLVDYLSIIANLPLLTIDVMPKIIEFLKAFNSRTCQVVLGAGALRSAGLKNITARHLALASQSLTIMVALIPYVRETFRRHLSPKQAVMLIEFDKLKRDFQEHQNEIYAKLISIMGDRLAVHCKSLQDINWAVPSSKPPPNNYMEVLVKETATLHKVLTRYLSAHASELIMSQVFAAINHRLSEEYTKIELPSQAAKDRLLEDAKYLHARLSALPGVGGLSSMLETVVMDKRLMVPVPPEPAQPPAQATLPPPPKPARRTLSSIFGKDSKKAPVPALTPEKVEVPGPVEEPIKASTPLPPTAEESNADLPHGDVNTVPEQEHPDGQSAMEEPSVAPTEAMHPEETPLSNGTEIRDTIAAPSEPAHADPTIRSHPNSPAGGDQRLSVDDTSA
ncbi:hypothetical protein FS749_014941 [Ceratobasidium sp. UAMH 11750]|nr:hypothetical protein FS749_014941 [Ceratobasidium sp. UAMH 11750]